MADELPEELPGPTDPVIQRLQQAFAHEEPAIELAEVRRRAARYRPPPGHGLTAADLVAARRREPAAVSRIYSAYAPATGQAGGRARAGRRRSTENPSP